MERERGRSMCTPLPSTSSEVAWREGTLAGLFLGRIFLLPRKVWTPIWHHTVKVMLLFKHNSLYSPCSRAILKRTVVLKRSRVLKYTSASTAPEYSSTPEKSSILEYYTTLKCKKLQCNIEIRYSQAARYSQECQFESGTVEPSQSVKYTVGES